MEDKVYSASAGKDPKVSVVIPTYKRPQLLLRAIESVLAQTEQNFEIIVIDDGSNDETASVVASLKDSRIHFFAFPENRGGSTARNKGVSIAKGTCIAFLDSDDYWLPQKLEKQLAIVGSIDTPNWLIYNSLANARYDGRRLYKTGLFNPKRDDISTFLIRDGNCLLSSGLLMTRATALMYPFDESLRRFQDTDLVIRMTEGGVKFFLCNEPTVMWSDDGLGRVSRSKNPEYITFWLDKMGRRLSRSARSWLVMNIARIQWNLSVMRSILHWCFAFSISPTTVFRYCFIYSLNHCLGLIPVKIRRFIKRKMMVFISINKAFSN